MRWGGTNIGGAWAGPLVGGTALGVVEGASESGAAGAGAVTVGMFAVESTAVGPATWTSTIRSTSTTIEATAASPNRAVGYLPKNRSTAVCIGELC